MDKMKAQMTKGSHVVRHRRNLKRLVDRIENKPLHYLPERSVECLDHFFNGYQIFGPPLWRDLSSFQFWLKKHLFYPEEDTGSTWYRFIKLNSKDRCDSFELFCRLYRRYVKQKPTDMQPSAPESALASGAFDFYGHLYVISKKPGFFLHSSHDVQFIAAYLGGYFAGKNHSGIGLTRDEKEFHRFGKWLCKNHKFTHEYPWYRLMEMWSRGRNSLESFFAEYDAFLTNFGERVGGLEDLFETVSDGRGTTFRRREKLPKDLIRFRDSPMWWRSPANQ